MDCCQENPQGRPPDMTAVMSRLQVVQTLWNKKRGKGKSRRTRIARQTGGTEDASPGIPETAQTEGKPQTPDTREQDAAGIHERISNDE